MTKPDIRTIRFGRAAPGLAVRDINAAYQFYVDTLGFQKVFENGNPVGFMILEKDRAEIHLSQLRDHRASTVNALHLYVNDVEALYRHCLGNGVRIVKSLKDKDYGQRAFVFADPDGNRIDVGEELGDA